jgi:F0F1-type ATP synthase membrane subunit b/b'
MGQDPRQTVEEIERTREEMAVKVDQLIDEAKVEAAEVGKRSPSEPPP